MKMAGKCLGKFYRSSLACETCDGTMQGIANGVWWCPRCGSTKRGDNTTDVPVLVERCRTFKATSFMPSASVRRWNKEIAECLQKSGDKVDG
jgi:tRNA(Ile2) C34 agmatinyltransferase TiaS